MLGYIRGYIIDVGEPGGVWCVSSASLSSATAYVGYDIRIPRLAGRPAEHGSEVRLWLHQVVREDAQELYGFEQQFERALFRKLISVSGIGPKTAVMMLAQVAAGDLSAMIGGGDADALSKIKGIGKKTAASIILALRDKLAKDAGVQPEAVGMRTDAVKALLALGFQKTVAEAKVAAAAKAGTAATLSDLVALSLRQ